MSAAVHFPPMFLLGYLWSADRKDDLISQMILFFSTCLKIPGYKLLSLQTPCLLFYSLIYAFFVIFFLPGAGKNETVMVILTSLRSIRCFAQRIVSMETIPYNRTTVHSSHASMKR
ncbi:hypothetical protein AVEN_255166-1 [Araneus ventricosus]|uniref:Uncharacterized protein n=1 Tax=Araneus ventricosus TaxID=182803 RepID=A0A4Y2BC17_ARAVE|nr:hypothetical protein AVEN_255166-1 [Araneus ventricosus]